MTAAVQRAEKLRKHVKTPTILTVLTSMGVASTPTALKEFAENRDFRGAKGGHTSVPLQIISLFTVTAWPHSRSIVA